MEGVGIRRRYLGDEGIRELYAELDSVFSDWSYTIRAVVDLADRVAVEPTSPAGVEAAEETALNDVGMLAKLSARGKVVEQNWYVESGGSAQALAAVGLPE